MASRVAWIAEASQLADEAEQVHLLARRWLEVGVDVDRGVGRCRARGPVRDGGEEQQVGDHHHSPERDEEGGDRDNEPPHRDYPPRMLRSPLPLPFRGRRPDPSWRISRCISPNCFSSRLTSAGVVPLPVAIRRRRLALISSGCRRSAGVIESMIASMSLELPVVDRLLGGARQLSGAGDHADQLADRPHLLDLRQLRAEVVEGEARLHQALRDALRLLLVDRLLRPLDERQDVAHPQDPLRQAIGVEWLEPVGALAGADEGDRQAGDAPNAERRAAARVAVHLGQHQRR